MLASLLLPVLLAAPPARADDWLLEAERAAGSAAIATEATAEKPKSDWIPYEPASRLFRASIPAEGWRASEESDAMGTIVRFLGPDDPSGALRATLTVRLVERGAPNYVPPKDAVEILRRQGPDRETTPTHPLHVPAGLARVFEIVQTRRLPVDEGPSAPIELHEYVAVIPLGDTYYLVRLTTARASYLDFREDFVRFLKSLRTYGAR